jgi:hypothetical protein
MLLQNSCQIIAQLHRSQPLYHAACPHPVTCILHPLHIMPPDACIQDQDTLSRRCTRLTSMDLSGTYTSPHVCNIPAGVAALQRLQHLGLRYCLSAPLPRSLSQMTRLTSLTVAEYKTEFQDLLFCDHDGPVVSSVSSSDATLPLLRVALCLTKQRRQSWHTREDCSPYVCIC